MQDIKLFYAIYFSKLCFVWVLFVLVCLGFCLFVCLGFQICFLLGVLALQHHVFSEFANQYGQNPKAQS